MYEALLSALDQIPEPYATTRLRYWDDEHISRSLLHTHLAPDVEGASRRHAFIDRSASWISSLLPPGASLLDIGCGPGLYAQRFCDAGLAVTGMDYSKRSIAYARRQAEATERRIRYLCQDYLTMDYTGAFDAVVLIYCDYGALSPEKRGLLLQKARSALRPGGLFIVDVYTPAEYLDFHDGDSIRYRESGFWAPTPYACIKRERVCGGGDYLEQYIVVTSESCRSYNLWNHAFSPDELRADLHRAGFRRITLFDDAAGSPFSGGAKTLCAVGTRGRG